MTFYFFSFQGWRGIWVSYQESSVIYGRRIDTLMITAPTTTLKTHPLFIDLLRLVSRLNQQTRDEIVPTIGQGIYTPNKFWQQTYRWSLVRSCRTRLCKCNVKQFLVNGFFFLYLKGKFVDEKQEIINCEHVIVQPVASLFFSVTFYLAYGG